MKERKKKNENRKERKYERKKERNCKIKKKDFPVRSLKNLSL